MEVVFLGDGSEARRLEDEPSVCIGATRSNDGAVWVLHENSKKITVRHAESGGILFHVSLSEQPRYVAAVAATGHVWVCTDAGNVHVFELTGTLIGVFHCGETVGVTGMFSPRGANAVLFTAYSDGTVVAWDAETFRPRSYRFDSGRGCVVSTVLAVNEQVCLISTSSGLWSWNYVTGAASASVDDVPAVAAAVVLLPMALPVFSGRPAAASSMVWPASSMSYGAEVWVALRDWIHIYSVAGKEGSTLEASTKVSLTLCHKIPCPRPRSLSNASHRHVTSVDGEGLVTVWDGWSRSPVRLFKLDNALGGAGSSFGAERTICLSASLVCTTSMWCLTGRKALVWRAVLDDSHSARPEDDDACGDGALGGRGGSGGGVRDALYEIPVSTVALLKDEARFMRRKDAFISDIFSEYRQTIVSMARAVLADVSRAGGCERGVVQGGEQHPRAVPWANTVLVLDKAVGETLDHWQEMARDTEPIVMRPPMGAVGALAGPAGSVEEGSLEEAVAMWRQRYHAAAASRDVLREWSTHLVATLKQLHRDGPEEGEAPRFAADEKCGGRDVADSETVEQLSARIREVVRSSLDCEGREWDLQKKVEELERDVQRYRRGGSAARRQLPDGAAGLTIAAVDAGPGAAANGGSQALPDDEKQQLQKEVLLLKHRLQQARIESDRLSTQLSVDSVAWQEKVRQLTEAMRTLKDQLTDVGACERAAGLSASTLRQENIELKEAIQTIKRDYGEIAETQHRRVCELQQRLREVEEICAGNAKLLARRNKELRLMEVKLRVAEQAQESLRVATAQLSVKQAEVDNLKEQLHSVEGVLQNRDSAQNPIGELQQRFEAVVNGFRESFAPAQVSESVADFSERLARHQALLSQLKHKDDLLACRDDEIALLKEALAAAGRRGTDFSTLFGELPMSVEEVERVLLELDEYRKRYGVSSEIQELAAIRSLDLAARRRMGDVDPDGAILAEM